MKFANLKVGDKVFVVHQKQRHATEQRTETLEVVKVGRKYGYVMHYGKEHPFLLENGFSYHADDCNARRNGLGFDVYFSEQEWLTKTTNESEFRRLRERIYDKWGLKPLKPETVAAIHKALDEHEVEE